MISILAIFLFSIINSDIQSNKKIIYNNSLKVGVERNLQIENATDLETGTDYYNIYYIDVINYTFNDREMNIYILSFPELIEEITLLITLYIDKYNDTLGYWTNKVINVTAYYYNSIDVYSAHVEDLTLDNLIGDISLTILNIYAESDNINNIYLVNFTEQTFNFQEDSDSDSYIFDSTNISVGRSTSSGISTGAIIGIIAGVVGVIAVISILIIYCFCCKKNDVTDKSLTNSKISIINPEKIEKDMFTIQFLSGDQHVNIPITCKVKDKFSVLEEKLYADFPDLKNKNIIFLAKGNVINRAATLEENKIKNDTNI